MINPNLRLLLLSNSINPGQGYLEHALEPIREFLGSSVKTVLFVPFAGVRGSWDDYTAKVRTQFERIGIGVEGIHSCPDPKAAVASAEAIVVGGGNTFHLLKEMYQRDLIPTVQQRTQRGIPLIGWSAGSNLACPTIRTTNDMPIVEPPSFTALGLVPFQINPHFLDTHPEGHKGETREERLEEFQIVNQTVTVIGLREGSWLRVEKGVATLAGPHPARRFKFGHPPAEIESGAIVWE